MAVINKKVGNTTYVCEVKAYRENGKVKHKWKTLGKLDADGNVIPSKKRASAEAVSLESLKASINSPDSLNSQNSKNSQKFNAANAAANDSNDTTITMITTATNMPIADTAVTASTAATTVADNVPDTTHNKTHNKTSDMIPVTSTSAMPDTKTATKTPPTPVVTDNTSYYDIPVDIPAEASLDVVHDGTIEAQISERQVLEISEDTTDTIATATVPATPEIVYDLDYIDYEGEAAELVYEQESGESSQRNLPQVISKKPTHFKMGTTKVENTLFDPIKNESIYEATGTNDVKINVSRRNSQKKRIETLLYIDFNSSKANGVSISFEDRITPYDREIHNAIITLAAAGNNCITPSMIFQLLSGNISDERHKMSDETRNKILSSVDKMRFTSIEINATAEVKAGMITRVMFNSYLIPAERTEVEVNGQIVKDGIKLIRMPPLFEYASLKNQVATINVKMLDTPLNNTPENIELKAYLLSRILSMSNAKNNMLDVIRYDTLYEYLRITAPNPNQLKKKHKNIRDKTKILLDFWKEEKLIKDYKEEREGKIIAKIIIYR